MSTPQSTDLELTIKSKYGTVLFEADRDNDVMIELEESIGIPRVYLSVSEATQVRDFLTKWIDSLAALDVPK